MAIVPAPKLVPMVDDPDDYRPESKLAFVVDPGGRAGRVDSFCAIVEEVAPGDRIPLHTHPVDELVLVVEGTSEFTLGDEVHRVAAGSTVFIPAEVPHANRNSGDSVLRIYAVFPGTAIEIAMLERNPAPGTEGRAPARVVYDARTGDFRELR